MVCEQNRFEHAEQHIEIWSVWQKKVKFSEILSPPFQHRQFCILIMHIKSEYVALLNIECLELRAIPVSTQYSVVWFVFWCWDMVKIHGVKNFRQYFQVRYISI